MTNDEMRARWKVQLRRNIWERARTTTIERRMDELEKNTDGAITSRIIALQLRVNELETRLDELERAFYEKVDYPETSPRSQAGFVPDLL